MSNKKLSVAVSALLSVFALVFLLAAVINNGHQTGHKNAQPGVIMETLDPSLAIYEPMWKAEIGRRFDNAVGILVHGGDFVEGQWIVGSHRQPWKHVTPIQDVVREIQARYPGRVVVLLACNTGHLDLGIPGVYYSKSSVWCVPDRAITAEMYQNGMAGLTLTNPALYPGEVPSPSAPQPTRWQIEPDITGNIYEFVVE